MLLPPAVLYRRLCTKKCSIVKRINVNHKPRAASIKYEINYLNDLKNLMAITINEPIENNNKQLTFLLL